MHRPLTVKIKNEMAYLYVWISIDHSYVYVGETARVRYGVIGRAFEHIHYSDDKDNWGTLRKNVFEKLELQLEEIDDFYLFSFPLVEERGAPDYLLSEMDRETVEYRVRNLWNIESIKRLKKVFLCESYAQYHSIYYDNKYSQKLAERIVDQCIEEVSEIIKWNLR